MAKKIRPPRLFELPVGVAEAWLYFESAVAQAVGSPEGTQKLVEQRRALEAEYGMSTSTIREIQIANATKSKEA